MNQHPKKNHRPWYEDWEEQCDLSAGYLNAIIPPGYLAPSQNQEIKAYWELSVFKAIFESNLIENAGMSESDTKKIIISDQELSDRNRADQISLELAKQFMGRGAGAAADERVIEYEKRKRPAREVIQHYLAILFATKIMMERSLHLFDPNTQWLHQGMKPGQVFSEKLIQVLHHLIARNLLPKDAGVEAGYYRIDNRTTDFITAFPAHDNVPAAMKRFIQQANETMKSKDNPILKAARISYDFVAIHPFPDFNGRMSRLIMNMVLRYERIPLLAVLKGSKKEKHRYITALRHADRGKITSYAALIARAVNEGFTVINANLAKAGQPPIHPLTIIGNKGK